MRGYEIRAIVKGDDDMSLWSITLVEFDCVSLEGKIPFIVFNTVFVGGEVVFMLNKLEHPIERHCHNRIR